MRNILIISRFKALALTTALVGLLYIQAGAGALPDSGQTKCYNNTEEIACPERGESFYGQDGNFSITPPSYTKLDGSGNALPDNETSWVMVRDTVTGLIWENKQSASNGSADYTNHNDPDNIYTWYDGITGTPGTDNDTQDFIAAINAANYGGHDDWRLPEPAELMTIIDFSQRTPAINANYFSNTKNGGFWSAKTFVNNADRAFYGSFSYGTIEDRPKAEIYFARAVRGGNSGASHVLIENGDGTVTDNTTGFMWQKILSTEDYTWENALAYCNGMTTAGYTDWRLPSIRELFSIVDYSRSSPSADSSYFTNLTSDWHRSSTTYAYGAGNSFIVYMENGGSNWIQKSTDTKVWAVRSERSGLTISACDVTPLLLNPGMEATITCSAVTDNGSIAEYRWDFDADGDIDNTSTAGSITKTYQTRGAYKAKIIAENTGGLNASRRIDIRVVECVDHDNDGYGDNCTAGPDCADNNPAVNPGATELCNGIDDNCNGQTDEGLLTNYFQDSDADGYGNPTASTQACAAPSGYVTDSTDCNDTNPNLHDNCACIDTDTDGYGDNCTAGPDCDDTDPAVHDNCTTCSVVLKPGKISKLFSFFFPVRRIIISSQNAAVFPQDPEVIWDTDSIETLSVKLKNDTTIIAWVRIKPRLLEANETYSVIASGCTGTLSIWGY